MHYIANLIQGLHSSTVCTVPCPVLCGTLVGMAQCTAVAVLQIGMELDRWLANHRPHLTCTAAVQRHSGALYQVQEHCIRYSTQEMGEYKSGSPTSTSGGSIRSVGKLDLGDTWSVLQNITMEG